MVVDVCLILDKFILGLYILHAMWSEALNQRDDRLPAHVQDIHASHIGHFRPRFFSVDNPTCAQSSSYEEDVIASPCAELTRV